MHNNTTEKNRKHVLKDWVTEDLPRGHLSVILPTLTIVAGIMDAVTFDAFDSTFVMNQTGNLVILGVSTINIDAKVRLSKSYQVAFFSVFILPHIRVLCVAKPHVQMQLRPSHNIQLEIISSQYDSNLNKLSNREE
jgi:uncharacterized membrane protein YoaK (UPF0700 family)